MNKPEIEGDLLRIPYADKVDKNNVMYTKELEYDMWVSAIGSSVAGMIIENVSHDDKWIYAELKYPEPIYLGEES